MTERTPPKVTVDKSATPSAELIKAAQVEVEVTDSTGRKIKLRKPGVLAQYRLVKAIGAESAANTTLVQMYLPVLYVAQIGEEVVFPPSTEREVEAVISLLDEAGLVAVMKGVQEHFGGADGEAAKEAVRK